jgi:lipooligosaccharide transport system permease protein
MSTMNAQVNLDDVVVGELAWAAIKALRSGVAIMAVVATLGLAHGAVSLLILPVVLPIGLTFAGTDLVVNALARGSDFFIYYFTLVITPMSFLSGVFFPVAELPKWLQVICRALPLGHAVDLVRPLLMGQ